MTRQVSSATMTRINLLVVLALVALVAIFISEVSGTQDLLQNPDSYKNIRPRNTLVRVKRQLESFDEDYAPSSNQNSQEEPSFWDRIVKAALKLFNRFIEWLNSS